jgi:undecaprenyl pyrophosphate phosphatase UppP
MAVSHLASIKGVDERCRVHPISYLQAIVLGLIQGVAEPFPIYRVGHAVIVPQLFGWNIHQNDEYFLAFLVATHCATAPVLLSYFLAAALTTCLAVRLLLRFFKSNRPTPFGIYCLVAGVVLTIGFAL